MRIRLVFLRQGDKFENGSVRNCVKYVVSSLSELICASLFDTMVPDEPGYLTPPYEFILIGELQLLCIKMVDPLPPNSHLSPLYWFISSRI